MQRTKQDKRKRIHNRIRKKIKGTTARPRLSVYRSNKAIYCQIIDDLEGKTIVAASSRENVIDCANTNKSDQAKQVGKLVAQRAAAKNISNVVFDRAGYLYHGRVKALAEGAREGGLVL